jgi:hypothetical protein
VLSVAGLEKGGCRAFVVCDSQVGLVKGEVAEVLKSFPDVFIVEPRSVRLNPAFRDYNERSLRVEEVLKNCRERDAFIALRGWRDEVTIYYR